jgi:hypothetical protein
MKYLYPCKPNPLSPESRYFDDLDRLLDLAHENGLGVTLNTITLGGLATRVVRAT